MTRRIYLYMRQSADSVFWELGIWKWNVSLISNLNLLIERKYNIWGHPVHVELFDIERIWAIIKSFNIQSIDLWQLVNFKVGNIGFLMRANFNFTNFNRRDHSQKNSLTGKGPSWRYYQRWDNLKFCAVGSWLVMSTFNVCIKFDYNVFFAVSTFKTSLETTLVRNYCRSY